MLKNRYLTKFICEDLLEKPNVDRYKSGIRVVSADKFLAGLV
jgi:hypothetical protein